MLLQQETTDFQAQIDSLADTLKSYEDRLKSKDEFIAQLQEALRLERARNYGRSAERYTDIDDRQGWLFDEDEIKGIVIDNDTGDVVDIKPHKRKAQRGKRKPLPDYLPREVIEYRLSDQECQLDNGLCYEEIGFDQSEQLEIIPATVKVIQHIRYKYAVKGYEEYGIKVATMPTQAIAKSIASSGLLAHIVQSKFCYHLPLYRQQSIWQSLDVELSRSSMCRWLLTLGEKVQPMVDDIMEQMKALPFIQADETTVTVVNDDKKKQDKPSHQGYMWVYNNPAGVVYEYQGSRSGQHPKLKLEEFEGFIQSDAYSGYQPLFSGNSNRTWVGCMAHARRKFVDVIKGKGKKAKRGYANIIIEKIARLYKIEKLAKETNLSESNIQALRQKHSVPILNEIKKILDDIVLKTPPKSLLGKAIGYSLNNWKQLTVYTQTGFVPIDNNDTERKIKPFTVGRKNWLFAGNTDSAKASANLFTLIENAKLYNLKVFDYLKFVFDQIGTAKEDKDFEQLTPQYAQHKVPKLKPKLKSKLPD